MKFRIFYMIGPVWRLGPHCIRSRILACSTVHVSCTQRPIGNIIYIDSISNTLTGNESKELNALHCFELEYMYIHVCTLSGFWLVGVVVSY